MGGCAKYTRRPATAEQGQAPPRAFGNTFSSFFCFICTHECRGAPRRAAIGSRSRSRSRSRPPAASQPPAARRGKLRDVRVQLKTAAVTMPATDGRPHYGPSGSASCELCQSSQPPPRAPRTATRVRGEVSHTHTHTHTHTLVQLEGRVHGASVPRLLSEAR